MKEHHIVQFR